MVELARLERVYGGNVIVGSNPTPSARNYLSIYIYCYTESTTMLSPSLNFISKKALSEFRAVIENLPSQVELFIVGGSIRNAIYRELFEIGRAHV